MVVDHELAWLKLKEFVLTKRSFGQDELLQVMARAELESVVPEGERGFDPRPPVKGSSEPSEESLRLVSSGS